MVICSWCSWENTRSYSVVFVSKGIKTVERVVIAEKEKEKKKVKENGEKKKYRLLVEGLVLLSFN